LVLAALAAASSIAIPLAGPTAASAGSPRATLKGRLTSGARTIGATRVILYRTAFRGGGAPVALGSSITRPDGSFKIGYTRQHRSGAVLYLLARRGTAVRLAAALGQVPVPSHVVANERTTVAMGFAMAQFIAGHGVAGKAPGLQNAAAMADDLVDPRTGGLSPILRAKPNGTQTSTLRTFDSLANMLVPCVRSSRRCGALLRLATPPRGGAPSGTLEAVADIARNPWHNVGRLFALARSAPRAYSPALGTHGRPDAWIVALRFYGDGKSLSGPGNMAIDARGNVWVTSNYVYSRDPLAPVCGSRLVFKFTPTGGLAPGSPYTGGGLNGAGFGITFDPKGNLWVGNYGFSATDCQDQPPHDSVSEFTPSGKPVSPNPSATNPSGGFTEGPLSWPQGTVSDRAGNIWIANACNDTVTRYAGGNPKDFATLGNLGIEKPFDIAFNGRGQAFVTGNHNSTVAMLNPDGSPARSPISGGGLSSPLGIAADSHGNMWVANSGAVDIPCPTTSADAASGGNASVSLINSKGAPSPKRFTAGGLTIPWGIAVDGHDNVWVANFGRQRVTELCGVNQGSCPPGVHTGQGISPDRTGYGFDGLTRNTGIQIDPSGNVWIADNWKTFPIPDANPGGYEMVVYLGVAGPIRTPLIGPPRTP
jgi:sugar lactone lactonase YvrE